MDVATVLLLHKSSFIVGAICFCYVRWRSGEPGLNYLAAGYALMAVASTLAGVGEQGYFPLSYWKLASFVIGVMGYGLLGMGLLQLSRRKYDVTQWALPVAALVLSVVVMWARLYEASQTRAAIFNFATAVALLVPGIQILRDFFKDRISARFGLLASLVSAATFSLLVIVGIVYPGFLLITPAYAFFLMIICHFSMTLFVVVLVQERAEVRLRHYADTDALTGIPNRQHFLGSLPRALQAGDTCILLDVDYFKVINDRYGHETGDAVLVGIAQAIADVAGGEASFGRIGGEEFAIFLRHQTVESASQFAERVRQAVKTLSFQKGEATIKTSISAGISEWDGIATAEALRDQADQALYAAKRDGRDCVRVYEHVGKDAANMDTAQSISSGRHPAPRRRRVSIIRRVAAV
ncbi:GGDEF domain-containing protein [Rhizobium sp. C4]|uniref:GGDEF domain-containing protein n=1 Tax=Rhizobium sp. C4 TaxID=1349800 RepID=UPI001E324BFE|nr:GGDEF domain-containing protein [Rhizobium sp. C4]MCD2172379.1 GGDEF domain-containing protein [Rhizobium sp. C4]